MTKKYLIFEKVQSNIIPIICFFAILSSVIWRLFLGVELTDESYYISSSYRLLQGSVPFYDSWEVVSGSGMFSLPIFGIYRLFNGGTEGIFLFSRLSFFAFMCLAAGIMYLAVKPILGRTVTCLAATFFISFAPFSLYNWSYNNVSIILMCTGLFLIQYSLHESNYNRVRVALSIAGICHALMALSYPSMVAVCGFVPILIFSLMYYLKKSAKTALFAVLYYAAGGMVTAAVITSILLIVTGGKLFSYLPNLMTQPYYDSLPSLYKKLSICKQHLKNVLLLFKVPLCIALIYIFSIRIFSKKFPRLILLNPLLVFILFFPCLPRGDYGTIDYVFLLGPFCVFWIPSLKKYTQRLQSLFWLLLCCGMINSICVALTSGGAAAHARYALFSWALALLILMLADVNRLSQWRHKKVLACLVAVIFSGCMVFLWYNGPYREDRVDLLTNRIESGVFKGIYTTPTRAEFLEQTEKELKSLQKPGGGVLFLGKVPYAYLMMDMKPATPITWYVSPSDLSWIAYYYSVNENFKPDQIYYMPDIIWSLNAKKIYNRYMEEKSADFVYILEKEYTLTHEPGVNSEYVILFERTDAR